MYKKKTGLVENTQEYKSKYYVVLCYKPIAVNKYYYYYY